MINFLFLVTLLIYLAASIFQTLSLAISNRSEAAIIRPTIERIALWGTGIGFAFLSLFIALWWLTQGHFPMTHWTDSTAFFAWAITLIYLIIVRLTHLRTLGSFVMPVAFIAILISYSFATHTAALPEPLQNYWLLAHTSLIFLGYAAFIAAFGFGLMYLMAEQKIRKKTDTLLDNLLPSLGISDELGYRCTILGVILLTMGVIVGSLDPVYPRYPVEMARCESHLYLGDMVDLCCPNRSPPVLRLARTQSGVRCNHRFCRCPLYLCWG